MEADRILEGLDGAVKLRWRDRTLAEHLRERLKRGEAEFAQKGVFSGGKPGVDDDVLYTPDTATNGWPPSADVDDPKFQGKMAAWFADFACESEHTARGSLRQWWGSFLGSRPDGALKAAVRAGIIKARSERSADACPGLHAISEEEWRRFVESR